MFYCGLLSLSLLPFFYLLALLGFISMYAAYPNIKRYMIDPYETSDSNDDTTNEVASEEVIPEVDG